MFNAEQAISSKVLLRPKIIDYKHESEEVNDVYSKGTVVLAPLHNGMDITICNALRRILLGSFYGHAITAFQIEGVTYEFENINGVSEDVVQIGLNIKQIRLNIKNNESMNELVEMEVKGPCEFRAEMLEEATGIKVVNKEQLICTINSDSTLNFKFSINSGYNYLDATALKKSAAKQSGLIYVDALFNPIKKVAFSSEQIVINNEDYKKVFFTIETDGSIDYRDAIKGATEVLQDQLSGIVTPSNQNNAQNFNFNDQFNNNFDDGFSGDTLLSSNGVRYNIHLFKTIHEIEMPIRAHNAFVKSNILYLGDLLKIPHRELLLMPNLGRKSLESVGVTISKFGLKFDVEMGPWPCPDLQALRAQYETRMNCSAKKKKSENDWI